MGGSERTSDSAQKMESNAPTKQLSSLPIRAPHHIVGRTCASRVRQSKRFRQISNNSTATSIEPVRRQTRRRIDVTGAGKSSDVVIDSIGRTFLRPCDSNDYDGTECKPVSTNLLRMSERRTAGAAKQINNKVANRLNGAFFRMLNEEMYSKSSAEMFQQLQENRALACQYHEGYRLQMRSWKRKPTDLIIDWLRRKIPTTAVIGDLGCGDAKIARSLPQFQVKSFDLVASDPALVTEANIRNLPLDDDSIDVAVLCLSLMGTDWPLFITEARRILKIGGVLKIAEVQSRFTDVARFIKGVTSTGFHLSLPPEDVDSYFFILEFKKVPRTSTTSGGVKTNRTFKKKKSTFDHGEVSQVLPSSLLVPCLYKKR